MPTKTQLIKSGVAIATLCSTVFSSISLATSNDHIDLTALKASDIKTTQLADKRVITKELFKEKPMGDIAIINPLDAKANNDKSELMAKLAQIDFFSASFTQSIFDEAGNELQQGSGSLSVSKPNLVNWQTVMPDESLIVSDGENLWFYDPFVEQVSVYTLESAIANTPILLITSNNEQLWQDYTVSQLTDNRYLVTATNENARVKSLELSFSSSTNNLELSGFTILDATGQLSVITLEHNKTKPKSNLFQFTVPEGVYLDDQR